MKLALLSAILGSAAAFAPSPAGRAGTSVSETKADLETLGKKLNPIVGYFDPLNLSGGEFWGTSNESTIGFLRESEVKHGRIAVSYSISICMPIYTFFAIFMLTLTLFFFAMRNNNRCLHS